jgi:hypothetical protein
VQKLNTWNPKDSLSFALISFFFLVVILPLLPTELFAEKLWIVLSNIVDHRFGCSRDIFVSVLIVSAKVEHHLLSNNGREFFEYLP